MEANNFWSYSMRKETDCRLLEDITSELSGSFDQDMWRDEDHREKLKEKIKNKMHRLRKERDCLQGLRKALSRIPEEQSDEALRIVIAAFSSEKVEAALEARRGSSSSSD